MIAERGIPNVPLGIQNMRQGISFRTNVLIGVAAFLIVVLVSLPSLLYPFGVDQAMFAYVGDVWLKGGLPYRDAWDIKPPGIYALYAAAQALFGHSMASIRIADLIAILLTCSGLFVLSRRYVSFKLAAFGAALFGIAYYTTFAFDWTAQAESFALPLMVGILLCALKGRGIRGYFWPTLAGAQLGLLALLKTPYALFAVLAWTILWGMSIGGHMWKEQAAVLGAASLPVLIVVVYFGFRGALPDLIGTLAVQRAYSAPPGTWVLAFMVRKFWDFLTHHMLIAVMLCVGSCGLVRRTYRRNPEVKLVFFWLCLAILLIVMQWRCYIYHFIVLLPPLTLLVVMAFSEMRAASYAGPPALRALTTGVIVLLLAMPLALDTTRLGFVWRFVTHSISQDQYWACFNSGVGEYPFNNAAHVAAYLQFAASTGDYILVYDYDPAIYYLSGFWSASKHLSIAPIYGVASIPRQIRRRWLEEQLADVERRPPAFLVISGRPRNYGMTLSAEFTPPRIHFGRWDYEFLKSFTKDAIYRRLPGKPSNTDTTGPWRGLLVAEPPLL